MIAEHLDEIAALCRKYRVKRLDLFGSAARDDFDPTRSDVDLIAEFGPWGEIGPLEQFFDFRDELEALLGRHVDLLEEGAAKNPIFLKSLADNPRERLYAAA